MERRLFRHPGRRVPQRGNPGLPGPQDPRLPALPGPPSAGRGTGRVPGCGLPGGRRIVLYPRLRSERGAAAAESASGTAAAAWELEVNCFHRIVSFTPSSESSAALSDTASLRFQDWRDLLQTLLAEDPAEPVSVTVISKNPDQSADVLENLEIWAAQRPGLHCGSLTSQEAQEAQSAGIPCWKYQIYLQAKSLYPDLTPDDVKGMTMQELQNLLDQDLSTIFPGEGGSCGQESYGNHHRHGWE